MMLEKKNPKSETPALNETDLCSEKQENYLGEKSQDHS